MPELSDILDVAARATPVVLAVGALLSFALREKIKQGLSRSLMRDLEVLKQDHARELAELSARQQNELEAYKVSLIAEAERIKATQEVKKSLALKIAERRFISIAALLDAFTGLDVAVATQAGPTYDVNTPVGLNAFIRNGSEVLGRFEKLNTASDAASPFLVIEQKALVMTAKEHLARMLASRANPHDPPVLKDSQQVRDLFQATQAVETNLRDMLYAMEHLG